VIIELIEVPAMRLRLPSVAARREMSMFAPRAVGRGERISAVCVRIKVVI
jgi:hypothetical protein